MRKIQKNVKYRIRNQIEFSKRCSLVEQADVSTAFGSGLNEPSMADSEQLYQGNTSGRGFTE